MKIIYWAFQSLKLQKQNNTIKSVKKNPSSSNLIPLSPNKKQTGHNSYSTWLHYKSKNNKVNWIIINCISKGYKIDSIFTGKYDKKYNKQ